MAFLTASVAEVFEKLVVGNAVLTSEARVLKALPRRLVRRSSWLQSKGIDALWRFRPFQGVESAILVLG